MDKFIGTWRNKKCTDPNMDTFLDICKVPASQKKLFAERILEVVFWKGDTDNELKVKVHDVNEPKPICCELDLDKETEHIDIDGLRRRVVTKKEGDKLVEYYSNGDGTEMLVHRYLNADGNMITITSCNGVGFTYEWVRC